MSLSRLRTLDPWVAGAALGAAGLATVYLAAALQAPAIGLASLVPAFVAGLGGPVTGFVAVVVETVFASAFRRGFAVPVLRPNEIAVAGALAGLAVWAVRQQLAGGAARSRLRALLGRTAIDAGFAVVLLLYSVVALVVRRNELGLAEIGAALLPVQGWIAYRLAVAALGEHRAPGRLAALLLVCAAVVVAIGVLQILDVAGLIRLFATWFDSHHLQTVSRFHRMTSVVGTYSGLGALLGLLLTATAAAWRRGVSGSIGRPSWVAAAVVVAALGLLLTGTWAAWIGAGLSIAIVLLPLPRDWRARVSGVPLRVRAGAAGVALLIVLLAAPVIIGRLQRQFGQGDVIPESLITRFELWRDLFIPAIAQHPVFGVGLTIPDDFGWNTQESLYLQWLFQGGIVGTAGWLILVGTVFVTLRRVIRATGHWVARTAQAGLVALLVMGFVNAFLLLSVSSEAFWWLVGAAVAIDRARVPDAPRLEQEA